MVYVLLTALGGGYGVSTSTAVRAAAAAIANGTAAAANITNHFDEYCDAERHMVIGTNLS